MVKNTGKILSRVENCTNKTERRKDLMRSKAHTDMLQMESEKVMGKYSE